MAEAAPQNEPLALREQYEQEIKRNIDGKELHSPAVQAVLDFADLHNAEFNYEGFAETGDNPRKTQLGLDLALVRNDIRNRINSVPGYKRELTNIARLTDNFIGKDKGFKLDDTASKTAVRDSFIGIKNSTLQKFNEPSESP